MDTIYINGNILSLDQNKNQYEAMAIKDGNISVLGSNEDVLKHKTEKTKIIDLHNHTVLPGFIDSHMHILDYAMSSQQIDLSNVKSIEELIGVMKEANKDNNNCKQSFLIGSGFNQENFLENKMPTKEDLNQISSDRPIAIIRACLHTAVVNEKALEILFPSGELPIIEGGEILLDEAGKPNGILTENALKYLYENQPKLSTQEIKTLIETTINELASFGITSVHSDDFAAAGYYEDVITAYRELGSEGKLKVRVNQQCLLSDESELAEFINKGYVQKEISPYYRLGPLKIIADGSLGARTAYLRKPYADSKNTRGIFLEHKEHLLSRMRLANKNGMPIAVHAIGDATIEEILNCYEELGNESGATEKNPLRHGIVHCQITDLELLERFGEQEILAYIQPIFLRNDLHMVESRVGEVLAGTSYAFKTLMKLGVHTSGGSDCPVEHFNVMNNIYCAVTRKDMLGQPESGFHKEECLSIEEALQIFTIEGAYASREENKKGSLEQSKYADFVVLDQNILNVNPEDIRNIKILMTVVGGEITYCRN